MTRSLPWFSPLSVAVVAVALVPVSTNAQNAGVDSATVFFVSKSENRNQVHYVVKLDAECAPVGPAPVRGYWKELEKGPTITSEFTALDNRAYGIVSQKVERREGGGGSVTIALRALPERSIQVESAKHDGKCIAKAYTTIEKAPAELYNIHVTLKLLGIDSLLLSGWTKEGRKPVKETLKK